MHLANAMIFEAIMTRIAALLAVLLAGCAFINDPANDISGRPCPPGAGETTIGVPGCRY
jgi:hypothetical protein